MTEQPKQLPTSVGRGTTKRGEGSDWEERGRGRGGEGGGGDGGEPPPT